jgi:hypothetical protein
MYFSGALHICYILRLADSASQPSSAERSAWSMRAALPRRPNMDILVLDAPVIAECSAVGRGLPTDVDVKLS